MRMVLAILAVLASSPTRADIIAVDFAGTIQNGFYSPPLTDAIISINGLTFTSHYVFDTTRLSSQVLANGSHKLSGGTANAEMTIDTFGTFRVISGDATFIYNDSFSSILAIVAFDGYQRVGNSTFSAPTYGGFQFSTCPGPYPCGTPNAPESFSVTVTPAAVPSPTAGSGAGGALLAVVGLMITIFRKAMHDPEPSAAPLGSHKPACWRLNPRACSKVGGPHIPVPLTFDRKVDRYTAKS